MWFGETEANVCHVFEKARASGKALASQVQFTEYRCSLD
jgi:SpoVK/Ycf46/Vps4 family AAA+-type ATPase